MNLHEEHMKQVDAVNNATTNQEHYDASLRLQGFRDGMEACGMKPNYLMCDMAQFERGHEDRPMCCGVFLDWEPS